MEPQFRYDKAEVMDKIPRNSMGSCFNMLRDLNLLRAKKSINFLTAMQGFLNELFNKD
tara:strand:+ start:105 stop:278 length:174 start_codon:yes stop_codon:yes gene_type:complete